MFQQIAAAAMQRAQEAEYEEKRHFLAVECVNCRSPGCTPLRLTHAGLLGLPWHHREDVRPGKLPQGDLKLRTARLPWETAEFPVVRTPSLLLAVVQAFTLASTPPSRASPPSVLPMSC